MSLSPPVIPPEIKKRGKEAEESYRRALRKGKKKNTPLQSSSPWRATCWQNKPHSFAHGKRVHLRA